MNLLETKLKSRLAEFIPFGLILTDKDVNIIYVNKAFEEITGWRSDEVIGKNPNILSSGIMTNEYYQSLYTTINRGDVWFEKVVNKKKNGDFYHAMQKITRIDENKEVLGYLAIQEDITDQVRKEEELKIMIDKYRKLLEKYKT